MGTQSVCRGKSPAAVSRAANPGPCRDGELFADGLVPVVCVPRHLCRWLGNGHMPGEAADDFQPPCPGPADLQP